MLELAWEIEDKAVGQQLVEGRAGGVLVDRWLGLAKTGDLLGGHEGHRPAEVVLQRQAAQRRGLIRPRQAEVGQAHYVATIACFYEQVRRLDVAVDNPFSMG